MSQIPYPKIELTLSQDMLNIRMKYNGLEFSREVEGRVIEINGKLYFQPIGSNELYDMSKASLNGDIKPVIRYITLASGVYVPIDYVGGTIMEMLGELDKEYKRVMEAFNKVCKGNPSWCDPFRKFKKYYIRQFAIAGKQAKIIVDELKHKGFVFRARKKDNEYSVYVKGADGEIDGKWTPLKHVIKVYVRYGGGKSDKDVIVEEIDEEIFMWYRQLPWSPDSSCRFADVTDGGYFECTYGENSKIFPISPVQKPDFRHHYHVKYIAVGKVDDEEIAVALDYSVLHPTETVRDFLYNVITERAGAKYEVVIGSKREVCKICRLELENRPMVSILGQTYVYEVDGKLYYMRYNEYSGDEIAEIDKRITLVGNVKPDARYKTISGVYLPLDYLTPGEVERFERFDERLRKRGYKEEERAERITKKLVAILEKKGFKIEMTEDYVQIEAPDGKEGYYDEEEDWDYENIEGNYHATSWTTTMISGELALTAESIYHCY